jgi:hypothetical protein
MAALFVALLTAEQTLENSYLIVPTLRVGMQPSTLRVHRAGAD